MLIYLFANKLPKIVVEWQILKRCIPVQSGSLYRKSVQCIDECFPDINRSWCDSGQYLEKLRKSPKNFCQV
jgi:hypothetical protein